MCVAALWFEVILDRAHAPDLGGAGDLAVGTFEYGEVPGLVARRASSIESSAAEPQPSGHVTRMWM